MKTPRFLLMVVPLLACLPAAEPTMAQGRPVAGQSQNGTFGYSRKKVAFDGIGKKKPIEATLTLPRRSQPSPAVLFVTGAWTDNHVDSSEDESLRSLADYLGQHGIAVLQLKLPLGGRSTGDLDSANNATFEPDIRAGLTYLKQRPEIDSKQIGLFGQNENGAIAAVTSTLSSDVAFLILAGTPVVEYEPSARPAIRADAPPVSAYDLRPVLERVTCPVLILQGDQDTRLPFRANMAAYRLALSTGKNREASFVMLPGLNHALETTTGNGRSESDMAPIAMRTLTRWVSRQATGEGTPDNTALAEDGEEKISHRKPSNPFGDVPGGVIGQFRYRRDMSWIPPIGNQPRPYGDWYW